MCRSIKTLYHFDPPATEEEVRAAALQFVRKISGFHRPSKTNEAAFQTAVDRISGASLSLLSELETNSPPRRRPPPGPAKSRPQAVEPAHGRG